MRPDAPRTAATIPTFSIGDNFTFEGQRFILQAHHETKEYVLWQVGSNNPFPTRLTKYSTASVTYPIPMTLAEIRREWSLDLVPVRREKCG